MKHSILKILLLLFWQLSSIYSQTSTARFLYWSPSAEITAMGGAGVAIVNNSFAAYYNPASFAFGKGLGFSSSFMQPFCTFSNTTQFMLAVSFPIVGVGKIGFSFNGFWIENQVRTRENSPEPLGLSNDPPEFFSPTHYQIKASYAGKLADNISLGGSFSFLRINLSKVQAGEEMGDGTASIILLDAGFLINDLWEEVTYKPEEKNTNSIINNNISPGVTIGFSLLNFGPEISYIYEAQSDPAPSIALLGFSYTPIFSEVFRSRVLIDFEKRIYDSNTLDYIHFGGEVLLYKIISLRGGYAYNNINSDLSFPTFGAGVNYKFIYANVSRYIKHVLPTWQFDIKISLEN